MNYQTNIYCSTLAPVDWLNSCNTVCTKKFFCSTLWNWKPNVCTNTKYIQAVWRKIMATSRKMRLVRTDKHVTNNFLDWLQYNSICGFSEGKDCRYSKKFNSAIAVKPQPTGCRLRTRWPQIAWQWTIWPTNAQKCTRPRKNKVLYKEAEL